MESFLDKMQQRYAVKKYNPKGNISPDKLEKLEDILHLSPSSINSQPWKFVFVTSPKVKSELAEASYFNKEKVNESSCIIVFQTLKNVADFEQQVKEHLPEGAYNYFNTMLKPKGEDAIKNWMRNQVYLALGVLLSACAEMNIDSTPMEGIQTDEYDRILDDAKYTTVFAVALGEKDKDDFNQPSLKPKTRLSRDLVIREI